MNQKHIILLMGSIVLLGIIGGAIPFSTLGEPVWVEVVVREAGTTVDLPGAIVTIQETGQEYSTLPKQKLKFDASVTIYGVRINEELTFKAVYGDLEGSNSVKIKELGQVIYIFLGEVGSVKYFVVELFDEQQQPIQSLPVGETTRVRVQVEGAFWEAGEPTEYRISGGGVSKRGGFVNDEVTGDLWQGWQILSITPTDDSVITVEIWQQYGYPRIGLTRLNYEAWQRGDPLSSQPIMPTAPITEIKVVGEGWSGQGMSLSFELYNSGSLVWSHDSGHLSEHLTYVANPNVVADTLKVTGSDVDSTQTVYVNGISMGSLNGGYATTVFGSGV